VTKSAPRKGAGSKKAAPAAQRRPGPKAPAKAPPKSSPKVPASVESASLAPVVSSAKAAPSLAAGSNQQDRAIKSRELAIELARSASGSKCHQLVVLDVTGLSPVCDFLVLGTGTSSRQMRSTIDDAVETGEGLGYPASCVSGTDGEQWMLADFVDVVLHLFSQDSREYYDLDSLWGDAKPIEWRPS